MKLINLKTKLELANQIGQANTFFTRLKGLMFSSELPSGCALHIMPCQSVHTYFMNYNIDVLFMDDNQKVVGIVESMQPRKVTKVYRKAKSVIELPEGTVASTGLKVGDVLSFEV
ncbi:DUF192 domain-containing protein [Bacillus salitolerans]|uniref:DUF192 domain-containing protein n=1 Tax=Bacillus salitolerans TaxID=1437434 RepID=A0ABW4LL86_9BACI